MIWGRATLGCCSGLTPDSALGDLSWCWGKHIGCQGLNLGLLQSREAIYPLTVSLTINQIIFRYNKFI